MTALAVRSFALLLPLLATAALWLAHPPSRRKAGAVYLATLWTIPSLLLVQLLAQRFGWWSYRFVGGSLFGMPADLFLGWALLWGAIPALLRWRLLYAIPLFALFDFVVMPLCAPVLILGEHWLRGEAVAMLIVLIPAQLLAAWTARDECLFGRVALQVVLFAGLIVAFLPALILTLAGSAPRLVHLPWLLAQAAIVTAILGLTAVQELAERGGGTPFPYDPPKRLVESGVYAYIRNPMQLTTTLLFLILAAAMSNVWLALIGVMSAVYAAGLAAWDEGADLTERFGAAAGQYMTRVRSWIPSWRPRLAVGSTIYFAEGCDACSEMAGWIRMLRPLQLRFAAAETHPTLQLERVRYEAPDGAAAEGIAAIARALEHVHFGWALIGFAARLPVARHVLQLIFDAAGGGRRPVQRLPRIASTLHGPGPAAEK
jgi:protein-S-isoprenylcysteine O-methyltransferase Ste14